MKYAAIIACVLIAGCSTEALDHLQRAQYIANPHMRAGSQMDWTPRFAGDTQMTCIKNGNTLTCKQ